jgi:hypothetical protein
MIQQPVYHPAEIHDAVTGGVWEIRPDMVYAKTAYPLADRQPVPVPPDRQPSIYVVGSRLLKIGDPEPGRGSDNPLNRHPAIDYGIRVPFAFYFQMIAVRNDQSRAAGAGACSEMDNIPRGAGAGYSRDHRVINIRPARTGDSVGSGPGWTDQKRNQIKNKSLDENPFHYSGFLHP